MSRLAVYDPSSIYAATVVASLKEIRLTWNVREFAREDGLEQSILDPPVDDVHTGGFHFHQHVALLGNWQGQIDILHVDRRPQHEHQNRLLTTK